MLSQPIFDDKSLTQSLYRAIIHRFYDSINAKTQTLLTDCHLGFAPSPHGRKTFLIVTPSLQIAEQLLNQMDDIVQRVATLMVGIEQIGVCISPPSEEFSPDERRDCLTPIPRYMICQFINLPGSELES